MRAHLTRHHPEIALAEDGKGNIKLVHWKTLDTLSLTKLPSNSERQKKNNTVHHLLHVQRPVSIQCCRKQGFLLHAEDTGRYVSLRTAERVALTCEAWTSWSVDSYMIITAHYVTEDW